MVAKKVFAGHALRRIRRSHDLTQVAMAEVIGVSPSYLNLMERNQRPLTAPIILKLADSFDFDARILTESMPGGGVEAMRRRLSDPAFADLNIDRAQIEDWISAAPDAVEAFVRIFDTRLTGSAVSGEVQLVSAVRTEIEKWRNHFADLDMQAESLADELRLQSGDLYGAIAERLRVKHQLTIRILPVDVMPQALRRLDLHARQLQLSEILGPASRTFAAAYQLGQLEARNEISALVRGGEFSDRAAERLYHRHLSGYFASALMMPYARFLRACEATGYDIPILERRFGASFEQVAHRLTTLQRVGARGLPFFMIRIDRAGQVSKRFSGASGSPLVETDGRCPLWKLHIAFDAGGRLVKQLVELEDDTRWFTLSQMVRPQDGDSEFAVGLGLDARLAAPLSVAKGIDLQSGSAAAIGLGCGACSRSECTQRSAPPAGHNLIFRENERGLTPFTFMRE